MEKTPTELIENYEPKCCIVFVLDTSNSMDGQPIDELNRGLQEFHAQFSNDEVAANRLEVCVIEFNSSVTTLITPSLAKNFVMPTLTAKGFSKLVDGVREAINVVKTRKQWYKITGQGYAQPWIILISNGEPDFDQDLDSLKNDIINATSNHAFNFVTIGIQGANMQKLAHISSPNSPPIYLKGLEFSDFFKWIRSSYIHSKIVSNSSKDTVLFFDPSSWLTHPLLVEEIDDNTISSENTNWFITIETRSKTDFALFKSLADRLGLRSEETRIDKGSS